MRPTRQALLGQGQEQHLPCSCGGTGPAFSKSARTADRAQLSEMGLSDSPRPGIGTNRDNPAN
jgi:hypothetical protein